MMGLPTELLRVVHHGRRHRRQSARARKGLSDGKMRHQARVPVHPQDHILLGMQFYVDTRLPFGLRSAPLLFSAAADALEWVVKESRFDHVFHYIALQGWGSSLIRRPWCFGYWPKNFKGSSLSSPSGTRDARAAPPLRLAGTDAEVQEAF
jgi:hypothetical protein